LYCLLVEKRGRSISFGWVAQSRQVESSRSLTSRSERQMKWVRSRTGNHSLTYVVVISLDCLVILTVRTTPPFSYTLSRLAPFLYLHLLLQPSRPGNRQQLRDMEAKIGTSWQAPMEEMDTPHVCIFDRSYLHRGRQTAETFEDFIATTSQSCRQHADAATPSSEIRTSRREMQFLLVRNGHVLPATAEGTTTRGTTAGTFTDCQGSTEKEKPISPLALGP